MRYLLIAMVFFNLWSCAGDNTSVIEKKELNNNSSDRLAQQSVQEQKSIADSNTLFNSSQRDTLSLLINTAENEKPINKKSQLSSLKDTLSGEIKIPLKPSTGNTNSVPRNNLPVSGVPNSGNLSVVEEKNESTKNLNTDSLKNSNNENTEVAVFYVESGNVKIERKDFKGALKDFNKSVQLDPSDAATYNNRGISKYKLNDYEGAIADYSRAIELDPKNASAYFNRGIAKYNNGNIKDACADWNMAVYLGEKEALDLIKEYCPFQAK